MQDVAYNRTAPTADEVTYAGELWLKKSETAAAARRLPQIRDIAEAYPMPDLEGWGRSVAIGPEARGISYTWRRSTDKGVFRRDHVIKVIVDHAPGKGFDARLSYLATDHHGAITETRARHILHWDHPRFNIGEFGLAVMCLSGGFGGAEGKVTDDLAGKVLLSHNVHEEFAVMASTSGPVAA